MSKFFVKLPESPGLIVIAPTKLAAIHIARRDLGWPCNRSVMGAVIKDLGVVK